MGHRCCKVKSSYVFSGAMQLSTFTVCFYHLFLEKHKVISDIFKLPMLFNKYVFGVYIFYSCIIKALLCKDKQNRLKTLLPVDMFVIEYMRSLEKSLQNLCFSRYRLRYVLIKYKQVIFRHQSVKFCFCPPGCVVFVVVGQVQERTATHELK